MATSLAGTRIKDTFKQVLHLSDGVTANNASVYDGDGTVSGLLLSATRVGAAGGALLTQGGNDVTSTAAELNLLDGVTSTTTEVNILDGDTSATSTTLAHADRLVLNDGGTMKQVALTDFTNYFESNLVSGNADIGVGTIEFSSASLPGTATASVLRYDGTDLYLGYSS